LIRYAKNLPITELVEKHEGFGQSVKAIIERCQDPNNTIKVRPLADIIRMEPGFEQAVECVLGELTNAILVDSREDARVLINFIRENNYGRANFLIVRDALQGQYESVFGIPGRQLKDVIQCADEYRDVLSFLFRNIYLVDTSEVADNLFSQYGNCCFVTKEGYLREGPRVFDGALIETETSVLGRKERINQIEQDISYGQSRVDEEILRENALTTQLHECKGAITEEVEMLRKAELRFTNIEAERQALLSNMKRVEDECTVLDAEIYEEESTIDTLMKRGEELNASLNMAEEDNANTQNLLLNLEGSVKEKAGIKESSLLKIADMRGELSGIQISFENITKNVQIRREEVSEIKNEMEVKNRQIENAVKRIDELQNEILQLEADKQALLENKRYLEKTYADHMEEKKKRIEEFQSKEVLLKEEETEIEFLRNAVRDLDVKLTEVHYKKLSLIEHVSQTYKEDLTSLVIEIDDSTDWDEINDSIRELKQKLDKMGAVNLVAIEEHKELEERYLFLTKQKDDLVNAKESLHKAIIKINATTRKLFTETFEKVQVEFKNYFRMLFGGGQAEMFLLDERDVLESGIEIVVRPPGKKLQNILLLSGGEKALTAISLLFAIFKVNPSPFCVLDEIDAPLDETNIDRFTRVLHEFLKISQFIIITHNKKTIQMADVLYGITMAERGVSNIVSVKFAESKEEEDKEEIMV